MQTRERGGAHAKVSVSYRSHYATTPNAKHKHTYTSIDGVDRTAWLKAWIIMPDLEAQAPEGLTRRT